MLNYSSNEKEKKNPYSRPFTDNCLISLSSPFPWQENSNFGSRICPQQCWKLCFSPDARCAQTEARPWSRAAFQDAEQISPPEERTASEHFLPAAVTSLWTDQLWQAVCQNVTILNFVITDCTAHAGFLCVWMFLLCLVLVFLLSFGGKSVACADVTLTHRLGQGVDGRVFFFMESCCLTSIASSDRRNPAAHNH